MTESEALKILKISPDMKKRIPNLAEVYEVAVKAIEERQQYRAIGTIEEFKTLKEKNEPKKIAYQGEHEKCPSCGSFHVFGNFCTECGQAVDYD